MLDRKSTRLNSSHTVIYTLSLHDALPISRRKRGHTGRLDAAIEGLMVGGEPLVMRAIAWPVDVRSEEHTSELQSHRDLHSFPTRRSSDLAAKTGSHWSPRRCDRRTDGRR